MKITESYPGLLFLLVLAVYLPGLVAAVRWPRLAAMPVVTFTFLGMFLFTAAGSWQVMTQTHYLPRLTSEGVWTSVAAGTVGSGAFVIMLLVQALLFYAIAGPYVYLKRNVAAAPLVIVPADVILRRILALAMVAVLFLYYLKVGRFLLFDLLAGKINRINILEFRALTYGLKEYPFFRLGFLVFPALIAALSVGMASARGRMKVSDFLWIAACLVPPMLLAEKAAILNMSAVLFIAYGIHLGQQGRALGSALNGKILAAIALAFVPTAATYFVYFNTASDSLREVLSQFLFRITGVYSQALAATVGFVEAHGYLHGTTLPNLKGLLPHERFNLESAMQLFLGGLEVSSKAAVAGATPVPATGEGYVNFGWPGFVLFGAVSFLCMVLIQEVLLRLRAGASAWALSAWYGYLGFTLFTTSLFATFISLIHTVVAVGVIALWHLGGRFFDRKQP
ncbi:hypothetical protein [Polaromonas sp. LjRoot131]|uniref:hypothetical protein n=1 Tax=Polaromonas sp. LjRoot131 TaxID=3342262 RepID=UPI003ECC7489